MGSTAAKRQAAFKARMREQGLFQMTEWVPAEHRDLFRRMALTLREGVPISIGDPVTSDALRTTAAEARQRPLSQRHSRATRIRPRVRTGQ